MGLQPEIFDSRPALMTRTPFLLVPGLNCTAEIFSHQVPVLWPFGPVMIANHTRGNDVAEIAARILGDAPPRFALVGFSLGGYLAFEMLRQAGERVERLLLLDTSARPDAAEATEKRRIGIANTRAGAFEQTVLEGFPSAVDESNLERRDLRDLLLRMATTLGPDTYIRHQQAIIARPDSRGDLPGIRVKTLVVVGESDQTTIPAAAEEMAAAITGARLLVIPKAGHMALVERPELVNAAMREWAGE